MEVVALVISGIAALVAILSWLASRRSADAAEVSASHAAEVARIERERRHEERQPHFEVKGEEIEDDLIEFNLTVEGPERSYDLTAEVIDGSVVPTVRVERDGASRVQVLALGEVSVGVGLSFFGQPDHDGRRQEQRFLFTFESNEAVWTVFRECSITWMPRVMF